MRSAPAQDAHAAWDELVDTMIDFRVPVDPTETPRVTAQRLVRDADLEPAPAESATLLGRAEERARYARQPLQGDELTERADPGAQGPGPHARPGGPGWSRRCCRRRCCCAGGWAMAEASARWVESFSRGRDLLVRFSPRRLLPNRAR